jgi:hypothetical protein
MVRASSGLLRRLELRRGPLWSSPAPSLMSKSAVTGQLAEYDAVGAGTDFEVGPCRRAWRLLQTRSPPGADRLFLDDRPTRVITSRQPAWGTARPLSERPATTPQSATCPRAFGAMRCSGIEEAVRPLVVAAAFAAMLLTACTPAADPDARAAAEQFQSGRRGPGGGRRCRARRCGHR